MSHKNNGSCPECARLINLYPNFHDDLLRWFKDLQMNHPEAHVSCAGRGRAAQEEAYELLRSRAHFGESAHNYNAALDLFVNLHSTNIYDRGWFNRVIFPAVFENTTFLDWYGKPHAPFPELPHVEVTNWRELARLGKLKLVEPKVSEKTPKTEQPQSAEASSPYPKDVPPDYQPA